MKIKNLKYEQKLEIKKLYQAGVSEEEISQRFNVKPESISRMVKQLGNKSNQSKKKLSEKQIDEVCKLYENGLSMPKIAKQFNVSGSLIRKKLVSRGIKRRGASACHRKYAIYEDFFDSINTEEKAYFLGFLYADGCNMLKQNFVRLSLQNSDKDTLLKLAKLIFKDNVKQQIKEHDRTHDNKGVETYFTINSKHICHMLDKWGCHPSKTLILTYPEWMPDNLHQHFIRGYVDGDGGGRVNYAPSIGAAFKITSTEKFLQKAQEIIASKTQVEMKLYPEEKIATLRSNGNVNCLKVLDWLYKDASIYMARKYQTYLDLINKNKYSNKMAEKGTQGYSKSNIEKTQQICDSISFDSIISIDNKLLTKNYIKTLSIEQRENLSIKLLNFLRQNKWKGPDDLSKVKYQFNKLCDYNVNLEADFINGNHSLGTYICKFFCHSYYKSRDKYNPSPREVFEDDHMLIRVIRNRLGLDWKNKEEFFDISYKNIVVGMRSSGLCARISMFKPTVAKYMAEKFSNPQDVIFDYAAGFGGRMLGSVAAKRKYIGTDPLTYKELKKMKDFLKLENVTLLNKPSENIDLEENTADLVWSSPPYYNQEIYSNDISQAYNSGQEYFNNVYWLNTLKKCKKILKPNKYFGLNIKNQDQMLHVTKDIFGKIIQKVELQYPTSHLYKKSENKKEYIYIFKNNK